MEKVNLIKANTLIRRGESIGRAYTAWHPIYIVKRDEGFQYVLINRRFSYDDSKIL